MKWLLSLAFVTAGCNVSVGVDDVTWACATDGDCGSSARCVARACVPAPSPTRCTTRTVAGVSVGFTVADGKLVVSVDGRASEPMPLPAGVALDEPVVDCCEHHCCVERDP